MTEIATEHDLFKLFFETPGNNDHKTKGEGFILYETLRQVLDAKSFGPDGQAKLETVDEERNYLLTDGERCFAKVRQCDLRKSARAINGNVQVLLVGYLGSTGTE